MAQGVDSVNGLRNSYRKTLVTQERGVWGLGKAEGPNGDEMVRGPRKN